MHELTVALLQMVAHGDDQTANRSKGTDFCRRAAAMGADSALFPEMWNIGYTFNREAGDGAPDRGPPQESIGNLLPAPEGWKAEDAERNRVPEEVVAAWQAQAIDRDGDFVRHFQALAVELGRAIALTYLERWDGPSRNSVSIVDRYGAIAMTYAKVHTCDFDLPEAACTPGDGFYVCSLDTSQGEVKVGAMICYDREFPESARLLMLKGAELILTPNACDLEANRIGQFRARAFENMVGVAMANYAGPGMGHSIAFDPIAFDKNGKSRDPLIVEAEENEGIYLARFDLDTLRDYRTRETWGNAFRRPQRYGLLTSLAVEPPFARVNEDGEPYDRAMR